MFKNFGAAWAFVILFVKLGRVKSANRCVHTCAGIDGAMHFFCKFQVGSSSGRSIAGSGQGEVPVLLLGRVKRFCKPIEHIAKIFAH